MTAARGQVVVDRADLLALLDPTASPEPFALGRAVARLRSAADAATPAAPLRWDGLQATIARLAATDTGLDDRRRWSLDQTQAALRAFLSDQGADITTPGAVHLVLALFGYVDLCARHELDHGRYTPDEATAVCSLVAILSTAVARWAPPEARP